MHSAFIPSALSHPAHIVKKIKFKLWQNEHRVGNAAIFEIFFCRKHNVARVVRKGSVFGVVDYHGIACHGQRGDFTKRVNHCSVGVSAKKNARKFLNGFYFPPKMYVLKFSVIPYASQRPVKSCFFISAPCRCMCLIQPC